MTGIISTHASLVEAVLFIALYGFFSLIILRAFKKKKPDLRFWDPEIIFTSVITSAAVTKVVMVVIKKTVL